MSLSETQAMIVSECTEIADMLIEKNRKYGDSAINPIRIFSKASATEQILVRLDDKINRLKNQQSDEDEDVILDLVGYLVLYRIAMKKGRKNGENKSQQNKDVAQARVGSSDAELLRNAQGTVAIVPGYDDKRGLDYAYDVRDTERGIRVGVSVSESCSQPGDTSPD